MTNRRPRLAYPFTVLTQPDSVRLVAGEDFRYTLTGPGLDRWLPDLLARLTGKETIAALVAAVPQDQRGQAQQLLERLYGERVLVDGPASAAHVARCYGPHVTGQGELYDRLRENVMPADGKPRITILCQDSLDYSAALNVSRNARQAGEPFLWASYGPVQRAYVSPLFLPDAGPCFACLLATFQRLSPVPEIYAALLDHGNNHRPFAPAEFSAEGIDVLSALVRWKLEQAELAEPSAGLYRLHILDRASMEVSSQRVFADPECPECRGGRR